MADDECRAKVIEPDGRTVVLRDEQWVHIRNEHLEMARFERAIMETVTHPDDRKPDPRPGRERYYGDGRGPSRWLRVIVDLNEEPGWVVTAFGHDEAPS
jgi:hypothetical protein